MVAAIVLGWQHLVRMDAENVALALRCAAQTIERYTHVNSDAKYVESFKLLLRHIQQSDVDPAHRKFYIDVVKAQLTHLELRYFFFIALACKNDGELRELLEQTGLIELAKLSGVLMSHRVIVSCTRASEDTRLCLAASKSQCPWRKKSAEKLENSSKTSRRICGNTRVGDFQNLMIRALSFTAPIADSLRPVDPARHLRRLSRYNGRSSTRIGRRELGMRC
jgi:hypothetical protein